MALFEFDNVTKSFGGLLAVREVSFSLGPQEIVGTDRTEWSRENDRI